MKKEIKIGETTVKFKIGLGWKTATLKEKIVSSLFWLAILGFIVYKIIK